MISKYLKHIAIILVTTCSSTTNAAVPAENEWAAWPAVCRARFVVAGDGVGSRYESRIPKSEVRRWEISMGGAWYALHHYCYGLLYLTRASSMYDEKQHAHLLSNAIQELHFAYDRVEPSDPFYGEVASRLSTAYKESGDLESAYRIADLVIVKKPSRPDGYFLKSSLFREQGEIEEAIKVLEEGLKNVEHPAELHYALAINELDVGNVKEATHHATKAYSLGYPLQGLRNRLAERGITIAAEN